MKSNIRLAENDGSKASDNILQSGHLLGRISSDFEKSDRIFQIGHDLSRNEVKWEFHSKRSKVSLLG